MCEREAHRIDDPRGLDSRSVQTNPPVLPRMPTSTGSSNKARVVAFASGTVVLLLVHAVLFSSRYGVLGFVVDWIPVDWKVHIVNGLSQFGLAVMVRTWFALWFGWTSVETELTIGAILLWICLSFGFLSASCEVFATCPDMFERSDQFDDSDPR